MSDQTGKINVLALAAQWTHGPKSARKRLMDCLQAGHRFDARDREALAYLLMWRALPRTEDDAVPDRR